MKRSSCVSALLVGLSVTTASVALAAEPAPAPVKVALAMQPSDPQPSDPTAAPPTAPADGQTTPTEPTPAPSATVSLGGTTAPPGSDTPTQSGEEAAKKKAPRPWANSNILLFSSMSTTTIFRGQQQYANPTVDASAWFLPRYSLSDAFQLRGRLIFNYEMTNSDSTVTKNEPRFSDTAVQLFYRKIPAFAGIKPQVFIQAAAPTSPESRARTLIFSPGAGFNAVKPIEHVLGGEIDIIALASYTHPIYSSRQAEVRGQRPYSFSCAGGTNCQDLLTGTLNPSDTLSYALLVSGTWGKFSPALYYLGASQWVYHPKDDAQVNVTGGQAVNPQSPEGFSRSSVRQTSYFAAWLDYEINPWFTPEIGYSLSRTILTEDATYGNPFFDRYQDMRVYLSANFNIDAMIEWMAGGGADDQTGIIRSKLKHTPIRNF